MKLPSRLLALTVLLGFSLAPQLASAQGRSSRSAAPTPVPARPTPTPPPANVTPPPAPLPPARPVIVPDTPRWRVSERVEYNNKGLTVRVYRPYFADDSRYINDASFRQWGHSDQQFYDALGRPTRTINAKGYVRREHYLGWYTISEDENDTAADIAQALEQHIAREALT